MRKAIFLPVLILAACTAPGGPYPSLQARAAEAIDPRVPITRPINNRPASASLTQQLAALVSEAETGDASFDTAASAAERLADAAGAPQSESWIAAQEALTGAIAARKPTTTALSDVDEIASNALQTQRGIAPNDLAAIKRAAARIAQLDQQQAQRIGAIQRRLGL